MKIALFHDFLVRMGGAEHVLKVFQDIFPDAEIHTMISDPKTTSTIFGTTRIHTNKRAQRMYAFFSRIPLIKKYSTKLFIGHFPQDIDSTDLSTYDLVIANSGAWSHGLVTSVDTTFIVYMHSPMRFVWDSYDSYKKGLGADAHTSLKNIILTYMLSKTRIWDQLASKRESILLCNSKTVQKRIQKFYKRNDSTVLYPPVDIRPILSRTPTEREDFFLVISTFAKYKHLDVAIKACTTAGHKLVLIGAGPEEEYLRSIAGPQTTFAGKVSEEEKISYLLRAKAVIQLSEEDFGIVPVESMAAGTPVIGYGEGGILETIEDNTTGILFAEQTVESLQEALLRFHAWEKEYDPDYAKQCAQQFDTEHFKTAFLSILKEHAVL